MFIILFVCYFYLFISIIVFVEKLAVEIVTTKKQLLDAEKRRLELEEMRESFKRDMDTKGQETFGLIERVRWLCVNPE